MDSETHECWKCGVLIIGVVFLLDEPVSSPTGYPEDASWEEHQYCMECYNIITEGLDQEAEL